MPESNMNPRAGVALTVALLVLLFGLGNFFFRWGGPLSWLSAAK